MSTVLTEYNEAAAVALALEMMPPIKTVGDVWREYRAGTWREIDYHRFRPLVLSIMADSIVSNKRCLDVLHQIEGRKQVLESDFRSLYLFDGEAVLLNAANGIVRVEPDYHVELSLHNPAHNFTRQIAANYDPQARCSTFERVLVEALPDADDRMLLQLFAGSLLYPSCKFEAALVCYPLDRAGSAFQLAMNRRQRKLAGLKRIEPLPPSPSLEKAFMEIERMAPKYADAPQPRAVVPKEAQERREPCSNRV